MKPVLPDSDFPGKRIVFKGDEAENIGDLPAIVNAYPGYLEVTSVWELDEVELEEMRNGGRIYVTQVVSSMSGLQPISIQVEGIAGNYDAIPAN